MPFLHPLIVALLRLAMVVCPAFARKPIALVGAKIIPIEGEEIDEGVLVVRGKRIIAVGAKGRTKIPKNAKQIDAAGKTILPGLICTHSHVGGAGEADGSGPIQPGVRVYESLNVHDLSLEHRRKYTPLPAH